MSKGTLVEHEDGRRGIIYEKDQEDIDFPGKDEGKYLVTMTDENWEPRDVRKHVIHEDKLKVLGLQD